MGNSFGTNFKFTIFGQSHGPAIGVVMEGLPAGLVIDTEALQAFLDRRAPGRDKYSTARKETDVPHFLSGLKDGAVCGGPVTAVLYNSDTHSSDYGQLEFVPRPGHADYAAMVKYGASRDFAGGGQFSGRLTAPLCVAGGICLQILKEKGISIAARAVRVGGETEEEKMLAAIDAARMDADSVGGVVECVCTGVPAGVGEPMFGGMENRIAQAVFGIPAVKGIEFGAGFAAADLRGSENNDPFHVEDGQIRTTTNNHGGILGGITSGEPLVFRAAFKPTPSIGRAQRSVDTRTMTETELVIHGRHDPCVALRAVPVVEAAAAVAIYDAMLESGR